MGCKTKNTSMALPVLEYSVQLCSSHQGVAELEEGSEN